MNAILSRILRTIIRYLRTVIRYFMENSMRQISFIILAILASVSTAYSQVTLKKQMTLMGSLFDITVVASDSSQGLRYIDQAVEEISRIEDLISEWRPHTQISEVNRNAGIRPVQVDAEVFELTRRAIQYSEMSNGAFDISIAAMDQIWKFDGTMTSMPTAEAIQKSVEKVNYKDIILDQQQSTIFLKRKGMKIGFGSIGKGYAADRGRAFLQAQGVSAGIVNASGDLATWGTQVDGRPWAVGINNPFKNHRIVRILKLKEKAVATSGSYAKYAEIDGVHYAHIINPITGLPATGLSSVTIYGPEAEFANALSTSIMVLGLKQGLQLLKRFPDYKGILMTDKGKVIK